MRTVLPVGKVPEQYQKTKALPKSSGPKFFDVFMAKCRKIGVDMEQLRKWSEENEFDWNGTGRGSSRSSVWEIGLY